MGYTPRNAEESLLERVGTTISGGYERIDN